MKNKSDIVKVILIGVSLGLMFATALVKEPMLFSCAVLCTIASIFIAVDCDI